MQSILTADISCLYDMVDEINRKISDRYTTETEKECLKTLQVQITTEFRLRNAGMDYKKCFYRHENGNCAAIGGMCTANGYGEAMKRCQQYRETYILTTKNR